MLGRCCGASILQCSRRSPRLRIEFDFPEDQMAFEDRYGLPMSTSSEAAAQAYRHGIDLMLSAWPGAAQAMDLAIETDGEFALAYAATAPSLTESRARDIYAAYFPYFTALHILLDYFVDQAEDRAHGELNFVACYPNADEAHAGIARIARHALQRVAALEHPEPHVFALRAMCGYYCTRPALSKAARSAALEIMREAGVDVDPHPLLKLYARMART